jgi:hypothetical protein
MIPSLWNGNRKGGKALTLKDKEEEVMKRRGIISRRRFNGYQKATLVAGLLILFLAVALNPEMAPLISAGITGITILFLVLFRNRKPRKEKVNQAFLEEKILELEGSEFERPESLIDPKEKEVFVSREPVPSEIIDTPQDSPKIDEIKMMNS